MKQPFIGADLFMGIGGSSIALEQSGYRVMAAVDVDASACNIYQNNFNFDPICGDLTKVSGRDILNHYGLSKGDVSCLVGCPPCQGFSSLRRTRYPNQNDKRKDLILVFIDRIKEIKPKSVVFENVPGILREKGIRFFNKYLSELSKLGFVTNWGTLNAANYGVPQVRKRLVAISVRGTKKKCPMPTETHTRDMKLDGLKPWTTVRDSISDLPALESGESCPHIKDHTSRIHSSRVQQIISLIPEDGGSRKSLPDEYWLQCHKNLYKKRGATNIYGRLWWDKPAGTMTSRCTSPSCGRFLHPSQNRAISIREAARFQTFPDTFEFDKRLSYSERHIGNAVPIEFMKRILEVTKEYL